MKLPSIDLRNINDVPMFSWARNKEVNVWLELIKSSHLKKTPPVSPAVEDNLWPPSGMENLDKAFKWAIQNTQNNTRDQWEFYYGIWLASRGDTDEALRILALSDNGIARVISARILKSKKEMMAANKQFNAISEKWLQLHPQVIIERDKVLRILGKHTLNEREDWLQKVEALPDEWIIERRVQLLIDKGLYREAGDLLLSTTFQKVHQTYSRNALWMQLCEKLNRPCHPVPEQLGEDRLANFGAYREYE